LPVALLELVAGDLPFVRFDPHEVRLLPGLQQWYAATDAGVADEYRRRPALVA
jgi:hypothetical protein